MAVFGHKYHVINGFWCLMPSYLGIWILLGRQGGPPGKHGKEAAGSSQRAEEEQDREFEGLRLCSRLQKLEIWVPIGRFRFHMGLIRALGYKIQ